MSTSPARARSVDLALLGAIALSFVMLLAGSTPIPDLGLIDPDTKMRIALLTDYAQRGVLTGPFLRDNAPLGYTLHWTLPTNAMWLLLAAPLAPFLGWPEAIMKALLLMGPLQLAGVIAALVWTLRPWVSPRGIAWTCLLLLLSNPLYGYARIGEGDHHILAVASAVLAIGGALRFLRHPGRGTALRSGALVAAAFWVTIETAPFAFGAAAIAVAVGATRRRCLPHLHWFAAGLVGLCAVALAVDPPGAGDLAWAGDRVSLLYLLMFAIFAAAAALTGWLAPRLERGAARLGLGGGLVAAAALLCFAVWTVAKPSMEGAASIADPLLQKYWINRIGELTTGIPNLISGVFLLLPAGPAFLFAMMALLAKRRAALAVRLALFCAVFAVGLTIMLGMELYRFAYYACVVGAMVGGPVVGGTLRNRPRLRNGVFACGYGVGLALCALVASTPRLLHVPCEVNQEIGKVIASALPRGTVVLSDLWMSPGLLAHTDLKTVAGPYHRNIDGIRDVARFMVDSSDDEARQIIQRHGAEAVLLCGEAANMMTTLSFYNSHSPSVAQRLFFNVIPDWLEPVNIDSKEFALFRVKHDRGDAGDAVPR